MAMYHQTAKKIETPVRGPLTSSSVKDIIAFANKPGTSVSQLSSILVKEPRLMERIMRKANSSFYGVSRRGMTVDFAIVLLGFDVLKETVSSMVVNHALRNMVNALFHYEEFWNHSLSCGIVARNIAENFDYCDPDDAFVAGLLHDVGYMILHQYAADQKGIKKKDEKPVSIEQTTGVSHTEMGFWVAERWGLPDRIAEVLRWHHQPQKAKISPALCATVHIADVLCNIRKISPFTFDTMSDFIPFAVSFLHYDDQQIDQVKLEEYSRKFRADLGNEQSFADIVKLIKARFVETISLLSDQDKVIIALYYYEGLTFDEISQIMKLDEATVSVSHSQSIMKLKNVIWN